MLDLDELEAFAVVARTLSFSSAARRLYLTQSAVSRRVARLERTIGVQLLHRTSRQVTLTEPGRTLLSQSELLLEQHAHLLSLVRGAAV